MNNREKFSIRKVVSYLESLPKSDELEKNIDILRSFLTDKKVRISSDFSLDEFFVSPTATLHGITLNPNEQVMDNICELVKRVLQPARDLYQQPIHVSSGYRNAQLNRLVGGVSTSLHLQGRAADVSGYNLDKLFDILKSLPHTELILHSTYIHVAL